MPPRQVRALYAERTITLYQAYGEEIADKALTAGTFVAPLELNRMAWIKPSFLWMMYRSGWASKRGRERVLAVEVTRDGFEWAHELRVERLRERRLRLEGGVTVA